MVRWLRMRQEFSRERHSTTHFLTYADNNAVGYFVKQGFSKEIMLERERWFGYIKDYDGGTMMECPLSNAISYTKFPEMIRKQRQAVDEILKQYSTSHIVRTALSHGGCCAGLPPCH
jgi:histone acetyltransferase